MYQTRMMNPLVYKGLKWGQGPQAQAFLVAPWPYCGHILWIAIADLFNHGLVTALQALIFQLDKQPNCWLHPAINC